WGIDAATDEAGQRRFAGVGDRHRNTHVRAEQYVAEVDVDRSDTCQRADTGAPQVHGKLRVLVAAGRTDRSGYRNFAGDARLETVGEPAFGAGRDRAYAGRKSAERAIRVVAEPTAPERHVA